MWLECCSLTACSRLSVKMFAIHDCAKHSEIREPGRAMLFRCRGGKFEFRGTLLIRCHHIKELLFRHPYSRNWYLADSVCEFVHALWLVIRSWCSINLEFFMAKHHCDTYLESFSLPPSFPLSLSLSLSLSLTLSLSLSFSLSLSSEVTGLNYISPAWFASFDYYYYY